MANTIVHKRSNVPAKTPTVADLQVGEIAVNVADGTLFLRTEDPVTPIVSLNIPSVATKSELETAFQIRDIVAITDPIVSYTLDNNHDMWLFTNPNVLNVLLPMTPIDGKIYRIKNLSGNQITINPNGNTLDYVYGTNALGSGLSLDVVWSQTEQTWFQVNGAEAVVQNTEFNPLELTFTKQQDLAYFSPMPSNLIDMTELFASSGPRFSQYNITSGTSTAGSVSIGSNKCVIDHVGEQNNIVKVNTTTLTVPQAFSEVQINVTNAGGTGVEAGGVGLAKDADNFVYAYLDRLGTVGTMSVYVRVAGVDTFIASTLVTGPVPPSFKLGMGMVRNSITCWIDVGSGWVYVTGADVQTQYDFSTVGNLTNWNPSFFHTTGGGTSTWEFSTFKFGRHGGVGVRDQTIVTKENCDPYMVAKNKVLITANLVDARGVQFAGVFEVNLDTYAYTLRNVIFVQRDGKLFNDGDAHIVYYKDNKHRLTIATHGNGLAGPLQIMHKLETVVNLTSVGTKIVSGLTAFNLPNIPPTTGGAFSPIQVSISGICRTQSLPIRTCPATRSMHQLQSRMI